MTAQLTLSFTADETLPSEGLHGEDVRGVVFDGDATVVISNEAAENGYDQEPGALDWFNSARIVTSSDEDSVTALISVGDPRGAFAMTVRRLDDGRILLHLPHPTETMPHMHTQQIHEGTLVIVDGPGPNAKPADFSPELDLEFAERLDDEGDTEWFVDTDDYRFVIYVEPTTGKYELYARSIDEDEEDEAEWIEYEGGEFRTLKQAQIAADVGAKNSLEGWE